MKYFSFSHGKHGTFINVLGLWINHNPCGNCYSPAIVIDTAGLWSKPWVYKGEIKHPSKIILTIRTRHTLETAIHWRGWFRMDWNSGHLARWFGEYEDTDFGGFHRWRSHLDL